MAAMSDPKITQKSKRNSVAKLPSSSTRHWPNGNNAPLRQDVLLCGRKRNRGILTVATRDLCL